MIKTLRWLAIIPACILAWYIAMLIGLYVLSFVESLCPPDQVVSGFCQASWYPAAERIVICFGAALSAFFVVSTAAAVAPTNRSLVSRLALGVGALVAIWMAIRTDSYFEFLSAVVAGMITVLAVTHLGRRRLRDAPRVA